MKLIIYSRPDGGVALVSPSPRKMAELIEDMTENEALAEIRKKAVPDDATNVHVCDVVEIPTDRTFRDAWECPAGKVSVNMPRARDIHMGRIREARGPEFTRLDNEWMRATGQKNTVEAERIEAHRQVLRDIPQTLDLTAAITPDDLKAIWPAILPRA